MPHAHIRRYLRHGMLPQLAVFEASVRLGSLTSAADELHLAQPTVSTQMRKLTEAVGQPLFEHIGKRMRITPAGEVVYEAGREILTALGRAEQALAELSGLSCGRLRLAVGTTAKYVVMRMLEGFANEYPGVEVALEIHNRSALIARLAANEDDLYVLTDAPQTPEVLRQPIVPNLFVACARTDHPLATSGRIAFARFAKEPFLMRERGSATRQIACDTFDKHGCAPRVRMELATNEAVVHAVLAGLGVSVLSRHAFEGAMDTSRLATLDVVGFPVERSWQLVYPVGKRLPPSARAFMKFVREHAHDGTASAA